MCHSVYAILLFNKIYLLVKLLNHSKQKQQLLTIIKTS